MTLNIFLLILVLWPSNSLPNGLASTPPLIFVPSRSPCDTDEKFIIDQANLLESKAFVNRGYRYILIQGCWQSQRDKNGNIQQDKNRFPSGLSSLIQSLHRKGLFVGITTDIGNMTICGKPGSLGYQKIDSLRYASWGIDYVMIENNQNLTGAKVRFSIFSQFLVATGKRIMISINNLGKEGVEVWGSSIANTWKINTPINGNWNSLISAIDNQIGKQNYAKEGAWNDPGYLLNTLSLSQFIVQYAFWIGFKAPLYLLPEILNNQEKLSILLNYQLIALHQDSDKNQVRLIRKQQYAKGTQQVWGATLSNKRFLLIFLNALLEVSPMQISLSSQVGLGKLSSYWVRDPIAQQTLGTSTNDILKIAKINAHGVSMRVINM